MASRPRKVATAFVAFIAFSFSQVYVLAGLPNAAGGGAPQRSITAVLRTRGNQPIKVNGNDASTGQTILTGATLETGDQVSAAVDLGDGTVVEIEPGAKIELGFDQDGNVKVKVLRGCVMLKRKVANVADDKGSSELFTDSGDSVKTDKKRRNAGGCYLPNGHLGPFSSAGAGGGGGGSQGISGLALAGIIGGGIITTAVIISATRGGNPSPAR